MIISAALTAPDVNAPIAETYDSAACVMIAKISDLANAKFVTENVPLELYRADAEVIFCGDIYDKEEFELIAGYGVTRYKAPGMTAKDAYDAMERYELEIIRDFVGGTGCSSHEGGECDCGHDDD